VLPVNLAQFGGDQVNAVSGRGFHAFLEVGKVFRAWMPEQIEAVGFVEHQDYEVMSGLSCPDSDSSKARP